MTIEAIRAGRYGWPQGPLNLLAKAVLAPSERAKAAWDEWQAAYGIEETPWNEVRLLGAVAHRLPLLDPTTRSAAHIGGIRKFLWANSEMCLAGTVEAIAALNAAGIPVLPMKGLARVIRDPSAVQERLIRDADLLVSPDKAEQAFDCLMANGWLLENVHASWQAYRRSFGHISAHHAWSMVRGRTEIDLHHYSNALNRLTGDDDQMWFRSRVVSWRGVSVQLPSTADTLLMTIVHGIRWSDQANADWAIDASALIASGEVDWHVLIEESNKRRVEAILASGLAYLADELGVAIDPAVLHVLCGEVNARKLDELSRYAAMAEPITSDDDASAFAMAQLRNGDAGSLPVPEALENRNPRFAWRQLGIPTAERHEKMFLVPDDEGEFLLLHIQLFVEGAQNLPNYDLTAGIKGLTFFRTRPHFSALQGMGAVAELKAVLPLALLRERQARHFVLRYESNAETGAGPQDAALNVTCLVV